MRFFLVFCGPGLVVRCLLLKFSLVRKSGSASAKYTPGWSCVSSQLEANYLVRPLAPELRARGSFARTRVCGRFRRTTEILSRDRDSGASPNCEWDVGDGSADANPRASLPQSREKYGRPRGTPIQGLRH